MKKNTDSPTSYQFLFETPLYDTLQLKEDITIYDFFRSDIDAYNPVENTETTYETTVNDLDRIGISNFYILTLKCRRYGTKLRFFAFYHEGTLIKVGQAPSLADIEFADLGKKYDKLLNAEDLSNFKKAIGLASHGIGAGAFVYLRRIFENLITNSYTDHKSELDLSLEDFRKKRTAQKVKLLAPFLPSQLQKLTPLYSILSLGVHELTEETCLSYFPSIKLAIELILDEKIEMLAAKKKEEEINKALTKISIELKKHEATTPEEKAS